MVLRLKEILKEKGMASKSLASGMSITPQSLSNIANGKLNPSLKTLESAAQVLGVPLWQLFADPAEVVTEKVEVEKRVPEFIVCPHCGMVIPVEVSVRKLTLEVKAGTDEQ